MKAIASETVRERRIAVIDIGSNTLRLVIFSLCGRFPLSLVNRSVTCRLGDFERKGKDLCLKEQNMACAVEAIAFFQEHFLSPVDALHCIATAAVRRADNAPILLDKLSAMGLPVRVLSGEEECRLGASGVKTTYPQAQGAVVDMGGGSMDLALLHVADAPHAYLSTSCGFLALHKDARGDVEHVYRRVMSVLEQSPPFLQASAGKFLYPIGGMFRALARYALVKQKLHTQIVDGFHLEKDHALSICKQIISLPEKSINQLHCISARRAPYLRTAASAMRALLECLAPRALVFVTTGIREGLLYESMPDEEKCKDPLFSVLGHHLHYSNTHTPLSESLKAMWNDIDRRLHKLYPQQKVWPEKRIKELLGMLAECADFCHENQRASYVACLIRAMVLPGIGPCQRMWLGLVLYRRYGGSDASLQAAMGSGLAEAWKKQALLYGHLLAYLFMHRRCGHQENIQAHLRLQGDRLYARQPQNTRAKACLDFCASQLNVRIVPIS